MTPAPALPQGRGGRVRHPAPPRVRQARAPRAAPCAPHFPDGPGPPRVSRRQGPLAHGADGGTGQAVRPAPAEPPTAAPYTRTGRPCSRTAHDPARRATTTVPGNCAARPAFRSTPGAAASRAAPGRSGRPGPTTPAGRTDPGPAHVPRRPPVVGAGEEIMSRTKDCRWRRPPPPSTAPGRPATGPTSPRRTPRKDPDPAPRSADRSGPGTEPEVPI